MPDGEGLSSKGTIKISANIQDFSARTSKSTALMDSHVESDLEEKYQMLQRQMEAMQLELQKAKMGKAQAMCLYCYCPDHLSTECHMQPPRAEEANFMNSGWRRPEQQFNQGYNQNQRQHPGFQWSNP